jgi:surface antigen
MLEAERAPTVPWLHEPSRTGGVISPVGAPIRQGEATCRAVVVSIEHDGQRRFVQGNACRAHGYDWSLLDLRPWSNPA